MSNVLTYAAKTEKKASRNTLERINQPRQPVHFVCCHAIWLFREVLRSILLKSAFPRRQCSSWYDIITRGERNYVQYVLGAQIGRIFLEHCKLLSECIRYHSVVFFV